MRFFEIQIDFFKPLYRRIILVLFCFGWAGVELSTGALFWAALFAAIGVYAVHQFFLDNWPGED